MERMQSDACPTSTLLPGRYSEPPGKGGAAARGGDPRVDWEGDPLEDTHGVPATGAACPARPTLP